MKMTRRQFGALAGSAVASVAFGGACRWSESLVGRRCSDAGGGAGNAGRLAAWPRANVTRSAERRSGLGRDRGRDAILQLPANAASTPLPLLVLLHGASGSGEGVLRRLGSVADEAGVAVLAPDSRDVTWDAIRDGFGGDGTFVDPAPERVFDTVAVDPPRVAGGGVSGGAA